MSECNKKAKTADVDFQTWDRVRRFLMEELPSSVGASGDHPAILAAVAGLDAERKRRERDAKLRSRFCTMQDAVQVEKPTDEGMSTEDDIKPTAQQGGESPTEEDMTDDWQDVEPSKSDDEDFVSMDKNNSDDSALGSLLCKQAIASISEHAVTVVSPLGALAVALHSAMRSETLGFSCTGLPDEGGASSGGFAAPIRELPKSQFLPQKWESKPKPEQQAIAFRYRKDGTGAIVLRLVSTATAEGDATVKVTLSKSNKSGPAEPVPLLEFSLNEYLNTESFQKALQQKKSGVAPSLHYKSLPELLSRFSETFDLGQVNDSKSTSAQSIPCMPGNFQSSMPQQQTPHSFAGGMHPLRPVHGQFPVPPVGGPSGGMYGMGGPSHPRFGGDFNDDLMPSGLPPPNFMGPGGGGPGFGSGGQMGPGHPMFGGGGAPHPGMNPGGMQPRFDPFGPPGGPTEPLDNRHPRHQPRPQFPGGSGNPNDSHMRMPNDLNNMFS